MCAHPPNRRHPGRCSLELLEDVSFIAERDGVIRGQTKVGYPVSYREQLAQRLGVRRASLDRALRRASPASLVTERNNPATLGDAAGTEAGEMTLAGAFALMLEELEAEKREQRGAGVR